MIPHTVAGRPPAVSTLTDTVVLAELAPDTWDDLTDSLIRGTHRAVWEGPGSLGAPAGYSAKEAGDDRGAVDALATRTLRLPPDAPAAVGQRVYLNPPRDVVALAELDETSCYVISRADHRTTSVLQRVKVVSLADAEKVPK